MLLSWAAGKPVTGPMQTFAEGVATRVPFENTQRIMRQYLDDFVMVPDQAIEAAILLLLEHTHNLAEGAGAIPLAAASQTQGATSRQEGRPCHERRQPGAERAATDPFDVTSPAIYTNRRMQMRPIGRPWRSFWSPAGHPDG